MGKDDYKFLHQKEEKIYTEESIIKMVKNHLVYSYGLENCFVFHDWESDFFCVQKNGYSIEVEVKISKADLKADLKKNRHSILEKGYYIMPRSRNEFKDGKLVNTPLEPDKIEVPFNKPNKFYYAVPDGMITSDEIPAYAGLITCTSHAEIVKKAPFIHKVKVDHRRKLFDKIYYYSLELRRELALKNQTLKEIKEKVQYLEI